MKSLTSLLFALIISCTIFTSALALPSIGSTINESHNGVPCTEHNHSCTPGTRVVYNVCQYGDSYNHVVCDVYFHECSCGCLVSNYYKVRSYARLETIYTAYAKDSTHHWPSKKECVFCGYTENIPTTSEKEAHDTDLPWQDGGHSGTKHYFYKLCDTCNYKYATTSIYCEGGDSHVSILGIIDTPVLTH